MGLNEHSVDRNKMATYGATDSDKIIGVAGPPTILYDWQDLCDISGKYEIILCALARYYYMA